MNIIIVRHGESVNNLPDRTFFVTDPDLTPRGLEQARLLGERCAGLRIDALVSSPQLRALRTVNEISIRKGHMPVQIRSDMVEVGTEYATLPHAGALKICPAALPCETGPACVDPQDGFEPEFLDQFSLLSRAYGVISWVRRSFSQEANVLLLAHGGFNSRLIAAALRAACAPNLVFSQDNTGMSVVNYGPGKNGAERTRLVMMNDTSHLYGKDLQGDAFRGCLEL